MNVPKIKGTHNAMKSGMLAAEAVFETIANEETVSSSPTVGLDPVSYEDKIRDSYVWKELVQARNIRPSFHSPLGLYGGLAYTGVVWWIGRGKEPWTFSHGGP